MSYSPRRDRRDSPRRDSSPRGRPYRSPSPNKQNSNGDGGVSTTLFVGNLPFNLRERDMDDLFGKFGKIRHVKVGVDRHTGRSLGYGFVEFESRKDAESAFKKFDRYELYGRELRLDWDMGIDKKRQMGGDRGGGSRGGGSRRGYGGGGGGGRGRRYSPYGGGRGGRGRSPRSPRRYSRSPPRRRYSRSPRRYDRRPRDFSPRGGSPRRSPRSPSPRGGSPRRGGYSPEHRGSPRNERRYSGSPPPRGGSPPKDNQGNPDQNNA